MKDIAIIVPSRNRPHNVIDLSNHFFEYSTKSDLIFAFDDDDITNYQSINGVSFQRLPRMRIGGTLNALAFMYAKHYKYICFMGDDHRPKTHSWDERLIEPLQDKPGFSYGNDLLQGKNLPTAIVMSSSIINTLGYMVPPKLKHFYFDNFWMDMGNATNSLHYFDDVIIEHIHPLAQKSEVDDTYSDAWSVLEHDQNQYEIYKNTLFAEDLEKVKSLYEDINNRT